MGAVPILMIRPIRLPSYLANQSALSAPAAFSSGVLLEAPPAVGREKSRSSPLVVIRPIALP